jgi:putative RecB family exonuclease
LGTFAHRVLELLCGDPAPERTIERARELARQVWPETAESLDFQALQLDDASQRDFRWRAWTAIKGLWSLEDPADVEVRATEQKVSANLDGVPFFGIVDRLDADADGLVITDYKTGKAPRERDRSKSLDQVLLYAAAVEDSSGERPDRARLLYLGSEILGSEILETSVTEDSLGATTERFSDTWHQVGEACAGDRFEPCTGPLCGWCPYVNRCDEGRLEVEQRVASGRMRQDAPARALLGL